MYLFSDYLRDVGAVLSRCSNEQKIVLLIRRTIQLSCGAGCKATSACTVRVVETDGQRWQTAALAAAVEAKATSYFTDFSFCSAHIAYILRALRRMLFAALRCAINHGAASKQYQHRHAQRETEREGDRQTDRRTCGAWQARTACLLLTRCCTDEHVDPTRWLATWLTSTVNDWLSETTERYFITLGQWC